MARRASLKSFVAENQARLGSGVEAIKFAVQIDDHYDRLYFLNSWLEGDISDWPEFDAGREGCKPEAAFDPEGS